MDSPIYTFEVDKSIPPTVLLYSDSGTSLLSEYIDQHGSRLAASTDGTKSPLREELISRSTPLEQEWL